MTTVKLGTIDISRFVVSMPRIAEQTADYGQFLVVDMPVLVGENSRGFWEERNPASPFHGGDMAETPITVDRDGVLIWTGLIQGIRCTGRDRTAEVTLRSEIQRKLDSGCIYVSGTATNPADTPANIGRAICELYGIPVDSSSFGQSHGSYYLDNVLVSSAMITPEVTVRDALQQLAQIGCARMYFTDGKVHFELWRRATHTQIVTFSDNPAAAARLLDHPATEPLEKQETNGYSVQWNGGEAVWGTDPISVSGGPDAAFQIQSLQAAVWVGEKWLNYMTTAQRRISFAVSAQYGRALKLGYPIGIEYSGGGWDSIQLVDIVSIDNSNPLLSLITGVTR